MVSQDFHRVIIIGLDGATMDLIVPWSRQGFLPAFSRLIQEGASGTLMSTIPSYTIPAWPSFTTGVNPGKHGLYDFLKLRPGTYEITVETRPSLSIKKPTLWALLSKARRRVGVVAVPGTYPPLPVNGFLVSGMFTPTSRSFTYPTGFEGELSRLVDKFDFFFHVASGRKVRELLDEMVRLFDQRTKIVEHLLSKDLDFLMMVDNGTDKGAHEFWRFLDPQNPLRDKSEVDRHVNPLLEYYQYVDAWLEKLIARLTEDDLLILVSDHGSGPLHHLANLNQLLINEGYMKVKEGLSHRSRYALYRAGLHPAQLYRTLRRLGIEQGVADYVGKERMLKWLTGFFFSARDIDWSHSLAFASGVTGSVRLNLEGREPSGVVKAGSQRESLLDDLAETLSGWKDPEGGVRVISEVWKCEQIYSGELVYRAPDLVAVANDAYEFFGMHGFVFSDLVAPTYEHSGSHRRNGILIAYTPGRTLSKRGLEYDIWDVAPSILELLGLSVPDYLDGRLITDIMV